VPRLVDPRDLSPLLAAALGLDEGGGFRPFFDRGSAEVQHTFRW
jgi:hypothetical protein